MNSSRPHTSVSAAQPPALLLVTSAPPRAMATDRHRRAWELLETASQHYDVDLACLSEPRLTFDAWRELSALTRRLILAPAAAPVTIRDSLPVTGAGPLALQRWHGVCAALRRELNAATDERYDVIWCMDAMLAPAAADITCNRRVLDLRDSWCVNNHRLSRRQGWPRRALSRQTALIHHRIEAREAAVANLVVTADRRTAHRLKHFARVTVCPGGLAQLIRRHSTSPTQAAAPAAVIVTPRATHAAASAA